MTRAHCLQNDAIAEQRHYNPSGDQSPKLVIFCHVSPRSCCTNDQNYTQIQSCWTSNRGWLTKSCRLITETPTMQGTIGDWQEKEMSQWHSTSAASKPHVKLDPSQQALCQELSCWHVLLHGWNKRFAMHDCWGMLLLNNLKECHSVWQCGWRKCECNFIH